MIMSRAAQGTGAAMLTPAALSIIVTTYTGKQRSTALAIWGTIGSMGIAAGVLLGGVLTTAFGWRSIFFVNVPIGIVAAVLTLRTVARNRNDGSTATARAVSTFPARPPWSPDCWPWSTPSRTPAPTAGPRRRPCVGSTVATVLLAAFWLIERHVPAPLVPPATWRIRSLMSASTVMAVITGAIVGAIFISSLFLQQVLGASPVIAGLEFLPLAAAITLGRGHRFPRHRPRRPQAPDGRQPRWSSPPAPGSWPAWTPTPSYLTDVLPGFIVLGLGTGPMFVAISIVAMSGISHEQSGLASGVMMTGHEVGAALGVASLTAIAGDLTTRTGLIDAYPTVFTAIAVAMVALSAFAAFAVPSVKASAGGGHGHGHGMH